MTSVSYRPEVIINVGAFRDVCRVAQPRSFPGHFPWFGGGCDAIRVDAIPIFH